MSPLDIAKAFFLHMEQHEYGECAALLANDVLFVSPKFAFKSRTEWLEKFPEFHQKQKGHSINSFFFEAPQLGGHDRQIVRQGKVKVMGFGFAVTETLEINENGMIQSSFLKRS